MKCLFILLSTSLIFASNFFGGEKEELLNTLSRDWPPFKGRWSVTRIDNANQEIVKTFEENYKRELLKEGLTNEEKALLKENLVVDLAFLGKNRTLLSKVEAQVLGIDRYAIRETFLEEKTTVGYFMAGGQQRYMVFEDRKQIHIFNDKDKQNVAEAMLGFPLVALPYILSRFDIDDLRFDEDAVRCYGSQAGSSEHLTAVFERKPVTRLRDLKISESSDEKAPFIVHWVANYDDLASEEQKGIPKSVRYVVGDRVGGTSTESTWELQEAEILKVEDFDN